VAIRDELDAITMGFREAFATQDAARLAAIYAAAFACRPAEASTRQRLHDSGQRSMRRSNPDTAEPGDLQVCVASLAT